MMKELSLVLVIAVGLFCLSLTTQPVIAGVGRGSPQFRAISGVSMGGYGAMNIGLSHPDDFSTIACLGGPLDMGYLLKYIEVDMLGNYDYMLSYPDPETRIEMLQDLTITFTITRFRPTILPESPVRMPECLQIFSILKMENIIRMAVSPSSPMKILDAAIGLRFY
jgi:esterase/lipase superfamily enzyme